MPIPGYERVYEVSDVGNVRSLPRTCATKWGERMVRGQLLTASIWGRYRSVTLFEHDVRNRRTIGSLVLSAFVGPRPEGKEMCHCDGDYLNDRLENLRWDTRAGNFADKVKHGTHNRGVQNVVHVLTDADIRAIRAARGRVTQQALADRYGVTQGHISNVQRGKTWRHLHAS